MGTHPIFESDFDCLTEMSVKAIMKARLVAGSVRLSQALARNLAPGGKIFNDIRPPLPGELAAGLGGLAGGLVNGGINGGMWSLTTSEAALNAVCAFEVFCWYCVGESIGRGSLIGYWV